MNHSRVRRTLFALIATAALSACGRVETPPSPQSAETRTAPVVNATPTAVTAAAPTAAPQAPPVVAVPATAIPTPVAVPTAPPPPAPTQVPIVFAAPTPAPTSSIPVAAPGPGFTARRADGALPASISIPRFGTDASVVTLGVADDGTMEVPSDPDTIGWYDFTGKVGIPGNAVLVGHVDWAGRLRAFGRLRDLHQGDQVDVVDALEHQLTYNVESVETIDATTPPTEYLSQHGPGEELTLITCGGDFDHASHQYLSRVIVRAVRDTSGSAGSAQ